MTIKNIHKLFVSKALQIWLESTEKSASVKVLVTFDSYSQYNFEIVLFCNFINERKDPENPGFYMLKSKTVKGLVAQVDELIYGKITNNVSIEEDLKIEKNGRRKHTRSC